MSVADRGQPVEVPCGRCRCPGGVHASGDSVWLKPALDVPLAIAANAAIRSMDIGGRIQSGALAVAMADSEVQYALTGVYLRHSIVRWTFVDDKGNPISISPDEVDRLLPWGSGGGEVAEKADELYSEALFAPLAKAVAEAEKAAALTLNREQRRLMKKSSPRGRTVPSTSARNGSGDTPPEPSPPSSPPSSAGEPSGVLTP